MKILRPALWLLPFAALGAAAEAEATKEMTAFREAAHRILRVEPVAAATGEDNAMAARVQELRARLTMSAVNPERLASYKATFTKKPAGNIAAWKLTAMEAGCGGGNETMFATSVLLLPL